MEKKNAIMIITSVFIIFLFWGVITYITSNQLTTQNVTEQTEIVEEVKDRLVYQSDGKYMTRNGMSVRIGWTTKYGVTEEKAFEMDALIMRACFETTDIQMVINSLVEKCIKDTIVLDAIFIENENVPQFISKKI